MSEVLSITELLLETSLDLHIKDQEQVIYLLKKENKALKERLYVTELRLQTTPLSSEEIICIDQIAILKGCSSKRELSLDEVKRLDLLIKNLRLIRQQSTQVIESKDYINMKESDLVAAINSTSSDTDK